MPATVQMNTRISQDIKQRGDAVFARANLTPSQVVRAVWQSAADTQQVPECVLSQQPLDHNRQERLQAIRQGARLLERFCEDNGLPFTATSEPLDYQALRDEMYDEMLTEMEARHV